MRGFYLPLEIVFVHMSLLEYLVGKCRHLQGVTRPEREGRRRASDQAEGFQSGRIGGSEHQVEQVTGVNLQADAERGQGDHRAGHKHRVSRSGEEQYVTTRDRERGNLRSREDREARTGTIGVAARVALRVRTRIEWLRLNRETTSRSEGRRNQDRHLEIKGNSASRPDSGDRATTGHNAKNHRRLATEVGTATHCEARPTKRQLS